jgi:C4-dicarboxylate-specific signal transduction histidine kinase
MAVDLTAVVREVVRGCRARGWNVAAKIARNLPAVRGNSADTTRLAELLIAAGNAAGPPVQVLTKRSKDKVLLAVEDAGPAVEAKKLDAYFDPMAPARLGENSVERAACHTIARRLGADLEVHNLPHRGLAVIVKFASHSYE